MKASMSVADVPNVGLIFVHDGINSVADYNSLRVGVGWMDVCRLSVVRRKFHDWITFERLEILS